MACILAVGSLAAASATCAEAAPACPSQRTRGASKWGLPASAPPAHGLRSCCFCCASTAPRPPSWSTGTRSASARLTSRVGGDDEAARAPASTRWPSSSSACPAASAQLAASTRWRRCTARGASAASRPSPAKVSCASPQAAERGAAGRWGWRWWTAAGTRGCPCSDSDERAQRRCARSCTCCRRGVQAGSGCASRGLLNDAV